jgi:hypothetical protein
LVRGEKLYARTVRKEMKEAKEIKEVKDEEADLL